MNLPLIFLGKLVFYISRILNIGSGGTWPGEIALTVNPNIARCFSSKLKKGVIIIAGTNGKTTTSLMIRKILQHQGYKVLHNDSGANLLNGIVSAFIQKISWRGNIDSDWGVFEVDENSLPILLKFITPKVIVMLNLFRDQLDRYGEVDVIAEKWSKALKNLPKETKLILNADDPQIAYLGINLHSVSSTPGVEPGVVYFGLSDPKLFQKQMEHATDSIFCLNCGGRLTFDGIYYSHLGIWRCPKCHQKRPELDINKWESSLPGVYNQYNTLAAVGTAKAIGIENSQIQKALSSFAPAFGRQEELMVSGKRVKILLSKNPAGFNESLRTVISKGAKEILFVLNDRIPDGQDVSWIWDVDFEMLPDNISVIVSGDRVYDLALRIKYSQKTSRLSGIHDTVMRKNLQTASGQNYNLKLKILENLNKAIDEGLKNINPEETLYILPTYSAMLEVRKILRGRKIL